MCLFSYYLDLMNQFGIKHLFVPDTFPVKFISTGDFVNDSCNCIWNNLGFITTLGVPWSFVNNPVDGIKQDDRCDGFLKEEFIDTIFILFVHLFNSICKGLHIICRALTNNVRIHVNGIQALGQFFLFNYLILGIFCPILFPLSIRHFHLLLFPTAFRPFVIPSSLVRASIDRRSEVL